MQTNLFNNCFNVGCVQVLNPTRTLQDSWCPLVLFLLVPNLKHHPNNIVPKTSVQVQWRNYISNQAGLRRQWGLLPYCLDAHGNVTMCIIPYTEIPLQHENLPCPLPEQTVSSDFTWHIRKTHNSTLWRLAALLFQTSPQALLDWTQRWIIMHNQCR